MILDKFFFRKFYREKFWIFFAKCDSLIVPISTFRQNKSTTFWTLKIFPSSAFITFKTKEREREREKEELQRKKVSILWRDRRKKTYKMSIFERDYAERVKYRIKMKWQFSSGTTLVAKASYYNYNSVCCTYLNRHKTSPSCYIVIFYYFLYLTFLCLFPTILRTLLWYSEDPLTNQTI